MIRITSETAWHAGTALVAGALVAALGGLIGLGGAEFRLPVLIALLGYAARVAVPLNLGISAVTVAVALLARSSTLPLHALAPHIPILAVLAVAGMVGSSQGVRLMRRMSDHGLERLVALLLGGVGLLLIGEVAFGLDHGGMLPDSLGFQLAGAIAFGLVIGLVSSLLGVAGGEIIIPVLVLAYGMDMHAAGTASLLISLPVIAIGLWRYSRNGLLSDRRALRLTAGPMAAGSVIGAAVGGLLAGAAPVDLLKAILGAILLTTSARSAIGAKRRGSQ